MGTDFKDILGVVVCLGGLNPLCLSGCSDESQYADDSDSQERDSSSFDATHPKDQFLPSDTPQADVNKCLPLTDVNGEPLKEDITCDGVDDDCDGTADDDFQSESLDWYCGQGACRVRAWSECLNGVIHEACQPNEALTSNDAGCNGIDDDCDGETDENAGTTTCGVGVCEHIVNNCVRGMVQFCDPLGKATRETCNGLDDNCDGTIDNGFNVGAECFVENITCDGEGVIRCLPDGSSSCDVLFVHQEEEICDGLDNDCDGEIDEDLNRPIQCGVGVCTNEGVEQCVDGSYIPECIPLNPIVNEDAVCNGLDDDCDGEIDEDYVQQITEETCGAVACLAHGITTCVEGEEIEMCTPNNPIDEVCDGLDNDCDGEIDEPAILCACDPDGDGIITDMIRGNNLLNALIWNGYSRNNEITLEVALETRVLGLPELNISGIEGLECFVNLETLNLERNQIANIQPLSGLINLRELDLDYNEIADLRPLGELTNLQILFLYTNQIADIQPLAALLTLRKLYLEDNQIFDVQPLAGLVNLDTLFLSNNRIVDIRPLGGLVNLQNFQAQFNQIEEISSLANLVDLTTLALGFNNIADIQSLSGLVSVQMLFLTNNQIEDVEPLAGLVGLHDLDLGLNRIIDIGSLSGLTNLQSLVLTRNQIENIDPLEGLINLESLGLRNNPRIDDISPLINNQGLGDSDRVELMGNMLITDDQIAELRAKGVIVNWP